MSIFDKLKKDKGQTEYAPLPDPVQRPQEDEEDEMGGYAAPPPPTASARSGMSSPTEGRKKGPRGTKRLILSLLGVLLVGGSVVTYYAYDLIRELWPGGGASGGISARQSEKQMELLRQKQELENRLRLMTEDREKMLREADDRAKRYVDESLKNMPNAEALAAIADNQAKIAEALALVQQKLSQIGSGDRAAAPTPTPQPIQGSNAVTASFNTVQSWTDAARREEEDLKKQGEGEPAWDSRQGLQPGLMIPGILRTTLVSSTLLDRFQPCMQTTERIQVAPGFWLPAGVSFLGTAKADFDARRILVDINRLQYGNSVVPLKGVMLDGQGNPGMVTKYNDPLESSLWSIGLINMTAAVAESLQDMSTYVNPLTGVLQDRAKPTLRNAAYSGAANALQMQSQMMMEIQSRKKPVIQVARNIPVFTQITEKLPLDILVEAGIVKHEQEMGGQER